MSWTVSSGSPLGASIETSEITDGQITYAKLGTDVEKWELLETLNPSAVSTITSSTLTVKKKYKIVLKEFVINASINYVSLRVNGLSTNIYNGTRINNVTNEIYNASNAITLFSSRQEEKICVTEIYLDGKSPNIANGAITAKINAYGFTGSAGRYIGLNGYIQVGSNTQVETINLFSGSTFTGTIEIYGAD